MTKCVFCRHETRNLMCDECASKLSDLRYTVPRWRSDKIRLEKYSR